MRWSPQGAHRVAVVRAAVLDGRVRPEANGRQQHGRPNRLYARSRLYDAVNGRYVTVEQLRDWMVKGIAFSVNDTETGDSVFRGWRGTRPLDWWPSWVRGFRLRFNLDGRPKGKAAPANLFPDPQAEVWGVLYRLTRRNLVRLDAREGIPWSWYQAVPQPVTGRDLLDAASR